MWAEQHTGGAMAAMAAEESLVGWSLMAARNRRSRLADRKPRSETKRRV
jgi:hypothetical protein